MNITLDEQERQILAIADEIAAKTKALCDEGNDRLIIAQALLTCAQELMEEIYAN